jgi:hypothetical protein
MRRYDSEQTAPRYPEGTPAYRQWACLRRPRWLMRATLLSRLRTVVLPAEWLPSRE